MNKEFTEAGTYIHLRSERLEVRLNKQKIEELALRDLTSITLIGRGVDISTAAIYACCHFGVHIHFLSSMGEPCARISSPYLVGTVATRREQMKAYNDSRGVYLAKHCVLARLHNHINTLRYFGKYRKSEYPESYAVLEDCVQRTKTMIAQVEKLQGTNIDEVRQTLMGFEGTGGSIYWRGVAELLPESAEFKGRTGRHAGDVTNVLLNFGYGMLYNQCSGAIAVAGLEPFAGFLHSDRPGKPSLVLDFAELFRSVLVDRVVIAALNKGFKPEFDADYKLTSETKKAFAGKVNARLDARVAHGNKKFRLQNVLAMQARAWASYLQDSGKEISIFVGGW